MVSSSTVVNRGPSQAQHPPPACRSSVREASLEIPKPSHKGCGFPSPPPTTTRRSAADRQHGNAVQPEPESTLSGGEAGKIPQGSKPSLHGATRSGLPGRVRLRLTAPSRKAACSSARSFQAGPSTGLLSQPLLIKLDQLPGKQRFILQHSIIPSTSEHGETSVCVRVYVWRG